MTALSAKPTPGLNDRGVAEEVSLDASMEEILQSIRKIISDEQESPSAPPPSPADETAEASRPTNPLRLSVETLTNDPADRLRPPAPPPVGVSRFQRLPPGDGDVDTGHEPVPAPSAARNAGAPPARPPADRFPRTDRSRQPGSDGGSFARPPSPPAAPARSGPPTTRPSAISEGPEDLVSPETSATVSSAFSSLASTVMMNNLPSMEDLAREMLRPMLKTWLDDNLPTLVERLVRAEIERVARGGR